MKALILSIVALVLMSFSGCEREGTTAPADVMQLIGNWKLVEPASKYDVTLELTVSSTANTPPNVTPFDSRGQSAVNTYGTLLTASNDGVMSVGPIGSTEIAGPPEAMQFEQTYYANLQAVKRYELTGQNRLQLFYDGEKTGVLTYERIKQ